MGKRRRNFVNAESGDSKRRYNVGCERSLVSLFSVRNSKVDTFLKSGCSVSCSEKVKKKKSLLDDYDEESLRIPKSRVPKPFEVVVSKVRVVPLSFDKKKSVFVPKHKVVERRVFYGFYLMDDVVFFASEGLGRYGYRIYLRFVDGSKYPLLFVNNRLSPVEMEFRYGMDDDSGVSEE